jgi:3-methyladenine DNA glycosylase AlkC
MCVQLSKVRASDSCPRLAAWAEGHPSALERVGNKGCWLKVPMSRQLREQASYEVQTRLVTLVLGIYILGIALHAPPPIF